VFTPVFVEKVWGGRRIELFSRIPPPGLKIGESWEISDYAGRRTAVADGPFAGWTLDTFMRERPAELLGESKPGAGGIFPLLLKIIDSSERLSLQVHPDGATATKMGTADGGKEEAWLVLWPEKGGRIAVGLRAGTGTDDFFEAVEAGTAEEVVNWVDVARGDFIFVPPGTVHAIDQGLVLMEIQQTSDSTYRLYDWGRTEQRPLHRAEGREALRPDVHVTVEGDVLDAPGDRLLGSGDAFEVRSVAVQGRMQYKSNRSVIAFVLAGGLRFENDFGFVNRNRYGCVLLPAEPAEVTISGEGGVLLMTAR